MDRMIGFNASKKAVLSVFHRKKLAEKCDAVDPVGRVDDDFRTTRGGSHSVFSRMLHSANRSGGGERHDRLPIRPTMP
jgi:hypothetical protein